MSVCMRITVLTSFLTAAFMGLVPALAEAPRKDTVEDFRLADHTGRSHQLSRYKDSKAVVIFVAGNGCPIVRQSIPELKRLRDVYGPQGVEFLLLNANPQDDRPSIVEEAREFAIDLPILRDEYQFVARDLGIERTATALVVVPKGWKIVYRGAMDDRFGYGTRKNEAEHRWLEDAVRAVLEGQDLPTSATEAKGCLVTFSEMPKDVTYVRDVAPILTSRCVGCHSPGNIAPFSFDDYSDAEGWSSMMREVVLTRRMPPWHADGAHGVFANEHALTPEETKTLIAWIDAGTPRGEGDDPLLAAEKPQPAEWRLGAPDLVVELDREVDVPAVGSFDYQYFRVPVMIEEDKWVRAVDVQPTNRKVVHHALVFIQYPQELMHLQRDVRGGLEGYFAGYVPGQSAEPFPPGTGKFLPKGSQLVFQMHYTATGKPEKDRTRMGLYFSPEKPAFELETRSAHMERFHIPAGARDVPVTATYRIKRDSMLWSMSPHMHYRGSWFEYEAEYPDGRKELLLSVPHYDFNWQTLYRFKEPKTLPSGTVVVCRGGFDNSPSNPANPDPTQDVFFGEQTWDEMFIGYMELSRPHSDLTPRTSAGDSEDNKEAPAPPAAGDAQNPSI